MNSFDIQQLIRDRHAEMRDSASRARLVRHARAARLPSRGFGRRILQAIRVRRRGRSQGAAGGTASFIPRRRDATDQTTLRLLTGRSSDGSTQAEPSERGLCDLERPRAVRPLTRNTNMMAGDRRCG